MSADWRMEYCPSGLIERSPGLAVRPHLRPPALEEAFPRRRSCGIVILNAEHEVLLCHVTGHDHWDLPKGRMHPGETTLQTALRETREETSLALSSAGLLDLGCLHYRRKKDLHLFAVLMPRFDPTKLLCEGQCSRARRGQRLPEMDGFDWVGFEAIPELCLPQMAAVLNRRLNLRSVLQALSDSRRVA